MAEQNERRRFGDRKDGRLLRSMSPLYRLTPYLIPRLADAGAYYTDTAEISGMEDWLREKRKDGWQSLSLLHVFLAAYVRTVSEFPELNRFVSGQRLFARYQIEVVLVGRREPKSLADDVIVKLRLDPFDTVYDIYHKLAQKSESLRAGEDTGSLERSIFNLLIFPGVTLKFVLWLLRTLDYLNLLPAGLLEKSPFHGSLAITSMESAGARPYGHPLYPLGNLPLYITVGARRRVQTLNGAGEPAERVYLDFQSTVDSRVVDGYAWAAAMKQFREYLQNPRLLEHRPEQVTEDVF